MVKEFIFSIKGKITIVIFLIILFLASFAVFVFFQNREIRNRLNDLLKHNEPTMTLQFSSIGELNDALGIIKYAAFTKDTIEKGSFITKWNSYLDERNTIKLHCDTLNIDINVNNNEITRRLIIFKNECLKLYDMNYNFKYKNQNIDFQEYDKELKIQVENKIIPAYFEVYWRSFGIFGEYLTNKETHMKEILAQTNRLSLIIIIISFLIIIFSLLMWNNIYKYISKSIKNIVELLQKISQGELIVAKITSNDEIAEIYSASNILVGNLKNASEFAINIGKGEFSSSYNPVSKKDILGISLLEMKKNLQKFKDEDEKRFWINQGLAKFADIIRQNNHDLLLLVDSFLSQLVSYSNSNQGALYMYKKESDNSPQGILEMIACYAYQKKKFIKTSILPGEGLVGQTYKEKAPIHLKEIPDNFIKVTSGLGQALPKTLLFIPLMVEEEVLGIIELATFNEYESHIIDFIIKVSENLASVLLYSSSNSKMKLLLDDLQSSSEQMQSQEEELRQNMEELLATQEESARKEIIRTQELEELKAENRELKKKLQILI